MEKEILIIIMQLMINNPDMTLDSVVTNPVLIQYMQNKCLTSNPDYDKIKHICEGGK